MYKTRECEGNLRLPNEVCRQCWFRNCCKCHLRTQQYQESSVWNSLREYEKRLITVHLTHGAWQTIASFSLCSLHLSPLNLLHWAGQFYQLSWLCLVKWFILGSPSHKNVCMRSWFGKGVPGIFDEGVRKKEAKRRRLIQGSLMNRSLPVGMKLIITRNLPVAVQLRLWNTSAWGLCVLIP